MVQPDFDPSRKFAFSVPHESLEDAHNMTGLRRRLSRTDEMDR